MPVSALDIFKIGIGPSSSHTVGPMVAARRFAEAIADECKTKAPRIQADLYGSLGATGRGHGTDKAIVLGLMGLAPETVDVDEIPRVLERVQLFKELVLANGVVIAFDPTTDLRFIRNRTLATHANGMRFQASWPPRPEIVDPTYYSIGGGFVIDEASSDVSPTFKPDSIELPFPFK